MRFIHNVLVLTAVVAAAGCAATSGGHADDITFSGFLGSYDGLTRTDDSDMAAFRYVKPGLDLSGYHAILLERPVARISAEALQEVGDEDMEYLLGALDKAFRDELGAKWTLTDQAGPGVLRIRTCLSDTESATAAMTFTRIIPVGMLVSKGKQLATGTGINVGKAGGELEIVDSTTGERLFAAVDRRVGTGVVRNMFSSWDDVTAAFSVWAEHTAERLPEHGMPTR